LRSYTVGVVYWTKIFVHSISLGALQSCIFIDRYIVQIFCIKINITSLFEPWFQAKVLNHFYRAVILVFFFFLANKPLIPVNQNFAVFFSNSTSVFVLQLILRLLPFAFYTSYSFEVLALAQ
jgi:hypothetical protein